MSSFSFGFFALLFKNDNTVLVIKLIFVWKGSQFEFPFGVHGLDPFLEAFPGGVSDQFHCVRQDAPGEETGQLKMHVFGHHEAS